MQSGLFQGLGNQPSGFGLWEFRYIPDSVLKVWHVDVFSAATLSSPSLFMAYPYPIHPCCGLCVCVVCVFSYFCLCMQLFQHTYRVSRPAQKHSQPCKVQLTSQAWILALCPAQPAARHVLLDMCCCGPQLLNAADTLVLRTVFSLFSRTQGSGQPLSFLGF